MSSIAIATIVSLIAIGASVVVGVVGHLIDKAADKPEEDKARMTEQRP